MIGLDISDRSIKVVRLAHDKSRRLLAYSSQALPEGLIEKGIVKNPEEISKIIKKIFTDAKISLHEQDEVVASIPDSQSFLQVVEIPVMAEEQVGEAVQWAMAKDIPFGLENVYVDWQFPYEKVVSAGDKQEVQVAAAQKKIVDALYDTLSLLPLDVAAFELESQAIVRALVTDELEKEGLLIVNLGRTSTNVIIHDHEAIRFTASLLKGEHYLEQAVLLGSQGPRPDTSTEPQSENENLQTELQPILDGLALEVKNVVQFYQNKNPQNKVAQILLTGSGSILPGLERAFLKVLENMHIQRGNPWANVLSRRKHRSVSTPLGIEESAQYTTALGLALRKTSI